MERGEYARAGVDYTKIAGFKQMMREVSERTAGFPIKRGVYIPKMTHAHGANWGYLGLASHQWCSTMEGLGNKNWIAEWMYKFAGTGRTYYEGIGIDTAMMAVNDLIAQGALPVVYLDEVAAGQDDWFTDQRRSADLAESYYNACMMADMALGAGESPALKYLINALAPVDSAPSLSGTAVGIIVPAEHLITGEKLRAGDVILGVASSGLHANGISLVIKRALELPDQFLTEVPDGLTLGDEALIPTRCYVQLVEALLDAQVEIHSFLPGTGGGISKLAYDKRPLTYRVHSWLPDEEIPALFRFMRKLGGSIEDLHTTFNMGFGYFMFLPPSEVDKAIEVGQSVGYHVMEIGQVEDGPRRTVFEPRNLVLPPPEEG